MACFATPYGLRYAAHCFNRADAQNNRPALIPAGGKLGVTSPTAKNSKKNWHFHLLYYAGPAELLEDGRWSFEREWQRNKWRTNEWVPLKKLGRHVDLAADDWIPKLKQRWCDIVNEQAIAEGIATRFTNESNKARGIQKAQTRYSPGRQALRSQGFFTDADVKDNVDSWREFERHKRQNLENVLSRIQSNHNQLCADPKMGHIKREDKLAVEGKLARGATALAEATEWADAASKAMMLGGMIASGAKDVVDHYSGVDVTLAAKSATQSRTQRRAFAQRVCAAAQDHLVELKPTIDRLAHIQSAALAQFKKLCADAEMNLTAVEDRLCERPTNRAESKEPLAPSAHEAPSNGAQNVDSVVARSRLEALAHASSMRRRNTKKWMPHLAYDGRPADEHNTQEPRSSQWLAHQMNRGQGL